MTVRESLEIALLGLLIFSELLSFLPNVKSNGVIQAVVAGVKIFSLLRR